MFTKESTAKIIDAPALFIDQPSTAHTAQFSPYNIVNWLLLVKQSYNLGDFDEILPTKIQTE